MLVTSLQRRLGSAAGVLGMVAACSAGPTNAAVTAQAAAPPCIRPIVMTAAATVLALTPMAFGLTGGGVFISQPLALVVIGGLFSSTAMTLLVLPALYHLVESVGRRAVRVTED